MQVSNGRKEKRHARYFSLDYSTFNSGKVEGIKGTRSFVGTSVTCFRDTEVVPNYSDVAWIEVEGTRNICHCRGWSMSLARVTRPLMNAANDSNRVHPGQLRSTKLISEANRCPRCLLSTPSSDSAMSKPCHLVASSRFCHSSFLSFSFLFLFNYYFY